MNGRQRSSRSASRKARRGQPKPCLTRSTLDGWTLGSQARSTSLAGRPPAMSSRPRMSKLPWRRVLTFVLAAFFVVGSLSNLFAPGPVYAEYLRWGYPHWFHFVTGSIELIATVLLLRAPSRLSGAAL